MVHTRELALSHAEFDILWEHLGVGERPYPLVVPSFGYTFDERDQVRLEVFASLAARGLVDAVDVDRDLEDRLLMLVRNECTIDGQFTLDERVQVLAAARRDNGVLALLSETELKLIPVRASALAGAVAALLPEVEPGPGAPVTIPRPVFADAAETYAREGVPAMEFALSRGGVTGREVRTVSTLICAGSAGGGQLAANAVDQLGRRVRSGVLNWFDTGAGRYLVQTQVDRNKDSWVTIAPGDRGRIGLKLKELMASVRRD